MAKWKPVETGVINVNWVDVQTGWCEGCLVDSCADRLVGRMYGG